MEERIGWHILTLMAELHQTTDETALKMCPKDQLVLMLTVTLCSLCAWVGGMTVDRSKAESRVQCYPIYSCLLIHSSHMQIWCTQKAKCCRDQSLGELAWYSKWHPAYKPAKLFSLSHGYGWATVRKTTTSSVTWSNCLAIIENFGIMHSNMIFCFCGITSIPWLDTNLLSAESITIYHFVSYII